MSNSAMAAALKKAGLRSTDERIREIVTEAAKRHPRDLEALRSEIGDRVKAEADLLWEIFEPWRKAALDLLISRAAEERPAQHRSGSDQSLRQPRVLTVVSRGHAAGAARFDTRLNAASAGGSVSSIAARAAVEVRLSALDTLRLDGRPIGDFTPEGARGWADGKRKHIRFIELLTANRPPGVPLREYCDPDEADALWKRATEALDD